MKTGTKYKEEFITALSALYDKTECLAIFYFYFEQKWKLSKTALALTQELSIDQVQFSSDLQKLAQGMPVQYVVGETVFFNRIFKVNDKTLIPRQETEELVSLIQNENKVFQNEKIKILEIGTGSGVIAVSLAAYFQQATVYATDISSSALGIAAENAKLNHVNIILQKHDILNDTFDLLPNEIDILASNPPYIPMKEIDNMHINVVNYEPREALFVPTDDPLLFYRKITEAAHCKLQNGGKLYFEIYEQFYMELKNIIQQFGFKEIELIFDINNKPRFVKATRVKSILHFAVLLLFLSQFF